MTPNPEAYPLSTVEINRVALLTNPKAGKGGASKAAEIARHTLTKTDVDVVGISGSSAEASKRLAEEMIADPDIDALVVCGGDGLINLALQAHANSGTPMGIIPAGTGNDTARALGIPLDPRRAALTVIRGFTTTCDLGQLTDAEGNQRYFMTIACAGFDSLVSDRANTLVWPHGKARYNLAMAVEFSKFHSIPTRITLDDSTVIDDDVTLCAIGNTSTYGGGMRVCPHADHHDGLFDITVIHRINRRKAARNVSRFFTGEFEGFPEATIHRAHSVEIHMPGINVYADGDFMFPSPVTATVATAAGRIIVPRP
ncbi:diacylglycerol kinase [Corynebacterium uropygiale]|uniref:Diacylglycerol kinase n=1 Tax=Corynebacterium uropygiale TaxID=1775911 RepID=A0A9X1U879_9CORY|nr:diacylglycerol kinase [Corynebacterium uropygiale]MCF4007537.1 diacylglycerol kinase [Corynebacterium uropygiale]